jgi:hypothetical protein
MTGIDVRVSPTWLDQRERADADARADDLADALRRRLPTGPLVLHDLGTGTGALVRWLAPRLPGPQHWVLHDHDPVLLELAQQRTAAVRAGDGSAVTVETRAHDISRLAPEELAGAALVAGSALLDVLTDTELERLARACAAARCPVLFALTVVGRVELTPADPLDEAVRAAFDDHQRRPARDGRLLGPDAVPAAARLLGGDDAEVLVRPSPWRLGPDESGLLTTWLSGWVAAAQEQRPALAPALEPYLLRRGREAAAGALRVTVSHDDLLVLPRPRRAR